MNGTSAVQTSKSPKILLWIVILVALVLAVVYAVGKGGLLKQTPSDTAVQELRQQGTSDEVADIEQDLEATSFTDLDAELNDIDKELGF